MDIITETEEFWGEKAIGAVISIIKKSKDSIEAERKIEHWLMRVTCQLIAAALERIDAELYQLYKAQGWRVSRRDSRTIYCRYGELTYTRRLLQKGGKSFYPLDRKMGFEPRKHYSLGMIERIVEAVAITTARGASELLQNLAGITISHQSVIAVKNYAGEKAKAYEKALAEENKAESLAQPEFIAIEGDGFILKNKKKGGVSEVHRIQVYEGIRKNGNRTELVGLHCFSSTNKKELVAMVTSFLHGHYDLSKTTVLSNGDGGSGYQFQDFDRMVEGCRDHQHFRDCYHVHEKIRTRLSFCNRKLVDRMIRELHRTDDIMKQIPIWMDTVRSSARTEEDLEAVDKLQSYLERNAPYIPSLSQRGIHTEIHLGTAETNHRFYSYRMKRQGRSWSSEGMEHMVWVLTARKNKTLTQALLYHASGKSYKKMDRAMHKAAVQAERKIAQGGLSAAQKRKIKGYRPGCLEGRIGAYCPSSSSIGALAHAIQNY